MISKGNVYFSLGISVKGMWGHRTSKICQLHQQWYEVMINDSGRTEGTAWSRVSRQYPRYRLKQKKQKDLCVCVCVCVYIPFIQIYIVLYSFNLIYLGGPPGVFAFKKKNSYTTFYCMDGPQFIQHWWPFWMFLVFC